MSYFKAPQVACDDGTCPDTQKTCDSGTPRLYSYQGKYYDRIEAFVQEYWITEVVSWAVSAAAMVAIVVVLISHDHATLPRWPWNVTINTFISVFAMVAKTSLLLPLGEAISQLKWLWFSRRERSLRDLQVFDEASRGPWGSVKLAWTLKSLYVFCILSESVGVVADGHVKSSNNLAFLGALLTIATLAFDPFVQQSVTYPTRLVPVPRDDYIAAVPLARYIDGESVSKFMLEQAFIRGLTYAGMDPNIWMVTPTCPSGICEWTKYSSFGAVSRCRDSRNLLTETCWANPKTPDTIRCTYHHPINSTISNTSSEVFAATPWSPNTTRVNVVDYDDRTVSTMLGVSFLQSRKIPNSSRYEIVAIDCFLDLAVNTLHGSVRNYTFSEEVISSWVNDTRGVWPSNQNITPDLPQDMPAANEQLYHHLSIDLDKIALMLFGILSTNLDKDNGVGTLFMDISAVESRFESLAQALTQELRQPSDGSNYGEVTSQPLQNETYIHMRWQWLVYPIALQCMVLLVLLWTARETRKQAAHILKSSSLAVLKCGMECKENEGLMEASKLYQINLVAASSVMRVGERSSYGGSDMEK